MPATHPTRKQAPSFPLYASDFLGSPSVLSMSMTERGVYITLLCAQWELGSLPTAMKPMAALLKGVNEKQLSRMWPTNLAGCFVERGGRLINPRLERERKKQVDYRRRQSDNAEKRWSKERQSGGNATALPDRHVSGNAPSSPIPSPKERTHTHGGAPLHGTRHRNHAACGRVCVPADLHTDFVRALNTDDADQVLRKWYTTVDDEWSVGAKKSWNTGGNNYIFWRARFSEQWPSDDAAPKRSTGSRLPKWAQK
jgi:uncharacterized protein YdaU (DUF1376 family)